MLVAYGMSFVCFLVTQIAARFNHNRLTSCAQQGSENFTFRERDSCKAVEIIFNLRFKCVGFWPTKSQILVGLSFKIGLSLLPVIPGQEYLSLEIFSFLPRFFSLENSQ